MNEVPICRISLPAVSFRPKFVESTAPVSHNLKSIVVVSHHINLIQNSLDYTRGMFWLECASLVWGLGVRVRAPIQPWRVKTTRVGSVLQGLGPTLNHVSTSNPTLN